ncbi:hypothetical protein KCO_13382 [Pectobacterium brasiliense ICMP 19477]|nr:hypothetical protein KCO_13382 [Pectobacterium brasiliense ICMP 19477]
MQHQYGNESSGIVFIMSLLGLFTHQLSFFIRDCCYDRHRSVRLVICFDLAIDQNAQLGLNSLQVIYYLAKLFSEGRKSIKLKGIELPFIDFNIDAFQ